MKNKPQRGGIILYTIIDNQLFFGFGVDSVYNELTDFGGGISYKRDYNCIEGALREFCEETEGLYCNIKKEDVMDAPAIIDKHNLIIFLYTDESPDEITFNFQNQNKQNTEVKNTMLVTEIMQELSLQIP